MANTSRAKGRKVVVRKLRGKGNHTVSARDVGALRICFGLTGVSKAGMREIVDDLTEDGVVAFEQGAGRVEVRLLEGAS